MPEIKKGPFQPGNSIGARFMGSDDRSIDEIVRCDRETLQRLGGDNEALAAFLSLVMDAGKESLEGPTEAGGVRVRVKWDRGMLPCPFGESGLHPKMVAEMNIPSSGRMIRFSRLSIHLIRKHGFFGGKGSPFRLEPEELVRLIH